MVKVIISYMQPALIIHGGAWSIPDEEVQGHQQGLGKALDMGWRILTRGGSALDAVLATAECMEEDPAFDAGVGSFLNSEGAVQLDAALMDGRTLQIGAVAAISRVRHPLRLCRELLTSDQLLMVGPGAEDHAARLGLELCSPEVFITKREQQRWEAARRLGEQDMRRSFEPRSSPGDTVGALALDREGGMASACSTGGTPGKPPGRVGDSPVPGAGYLVDAGVGGCCCTGWGEGILRVGMAHQVVDALARGAPPDKAAARGVEMLSSRVDGLAGCIVLDRQGAVGAAFNTGRMALAWRTAQGGPHVAVERSKGSGFWRSPDSSG